MPLRHRHDHGLLTTAVMHDERAILLDRQLRVVPQLTHLLLLLVLNLQFGAVLHHAAQVRLRRLRQRLPPILGVGCGRVLRGGLDPTIRLRLCLSTVVEMLIDERVDRAALLRHDSLLGGLVVEQFGLLVWQWLFRAWTGAALNDHRVVEPAIVRSVGVVMPRHPQLHLILVVVVTGHYNDGLVQVSALAIWLLLGLEGLSQVRVLLDLVANLDALLVDGSLADDRVV